ncbi:uncharacterized protein LOC129943311 [Eupeodes corollae]|uniref:uncharacterized protein LOC129943311 n=1 Tax=Eupeodes corollae TaxID=290404 RepID=UPI0024937BC0|nr:uncharacterized protein LOC129943311 [Eupeodes corollae]
MESVSCVQILEIPCHTLDDLLAFEAKLQDDLPTLYAFQNLMEKMPYITLQKFLSGCLKYCMDDTVANKCSWEGKNNNLAVGDFTLLNVIQECARKKFPEARSADINGAMRKWFHYAKDRCRRKLTKDSAAS